MRAPGLVCVEQRRGRASPIVDIGLLPIACTGSCQFISSSIVIPYCWLNSAEILQRAQQKHAILDR